MFAIFPAFLKLVIFNFCSTVSKTVELTLWPFLRHISCCWWTDYTIKSSWILFFFTL